ncbi:MAG: CoA-transferase [Polyangia bacterium]|jgi:glutaconate CoA-transferase subunit B|nr:CoA-transferase [Polyangia bacterium]
MTRYNSMELMICAAARLLEDGKLVAVGTGAPCATAMLAQRTHAPNLVMIFEAGGFAPLLPTMPVSVGDSRTTWKALAATSMDDIMSMCQRGMVDYVFLGGAQIDAYGNLNSTYIGDPDRPKVVLPGSGGANDLASFCWRTMVITPQDPRRFVPRLDFLTTPGYLTGKGAREKAGLPAGSGPYKIITDLGILGFDPDSCRMRLESVHPGVTPEQVQKATGFELPVASDLAETPPPTSEALEVLRREVDPLRYIIGR